MLVNPPWASSHAFSSPSALRRAATSSARCDASEAVTLARAAAVDGRSGEIRDMWAKGAIVGKASAACNAGGTP